MGLKLRARLVKRDFYILFFGRLRLANPILKFYFNLDNNGTEFQTCLLSFVYNCVQLKTVNAIEGQHRNEDNKAQAVFITAPDEIPCPQISLLSPHVPDCESSQSDPAAG